jgi:hypothetical protein
VLYQKIIILLGVDVIQNQKRSLKVRLS